MVGQINKFVQKKNYIFNYQNIFWALQLAVYPQIESRVAKHFHSFCEDFLGIGNVLGIRF